MVDSNSFLIFRRLPQDFGHNAIKFSQYIVKSNHFFSPKFCNYDRSQRLQHSAIFLPKNISMARVVFLIGWQTHKKPTAALEFHTWHFYWFWLKQIFNRARDLGFEMSAFRVLIWPGHQSALRYFNPYFSVDIKCIIFHIQEVDMCFC